MNSDMMNILSKNPEMVTQILKGIDTSGLNKEQAGMIEFAKKNPNLVKLGLQNPKLLLTSLTGGKSRKSKSLKKKASPKQKSKSPKKKASPKQKSKSPKKKASPIRNLKSKIKTLLQNKHKVSELKDLLKKCNLKTSGNKADLQKRLNKYLKK